MRFPDFRKILPECEDITRLGDFDIRERARNTAQIRQVPKRYQYVRGFWLWAQSRAIQSEFWPRIPCYQGNLQGNVKNARQSVKYCSLKTQQNKEFAS